MRLTEAVIAEMGHAVLLWVATADAEGRPSVSPKEAWAPHGEDSLVVADIGSTGTVRHLRENPRVCVCFVDVFRQTGWRIDGTARIVAPEEPDFAALSASLIEIAGPEVPVRHVILVRAERLTRIVAPSYQLRPEETSEADEIRRAHGLYGVRPIAGD